VCGRMVGSEVHGQQLATEGALLASLGDGYALSVRHG